MQRLRRSLRQASAVAAVALAGYVGLGVVLALVLGGYLVNDWAIWPDFLPVFPVWLLGLAFIVVNIVDVCIYAVDRARTTRGRRRALAASTAWLAGPEAQAAAATGDPALGILALRVHVVEDGVELMWDNPSAGFEAVVVLRSSDRFASSLSDWGQTPLYRGKGLRAFDAEVAEGCVYLYSVFAVAGDGTASPPTWASIAVPTPSLVGRLSRRLNSTASAVTLYGADFKRFRRRP